MSKLIFSKEHRGAEIRPHRIESFFAFHPHANRLFHHPTFMNNMCYPPTHPNFPSTAVLHALCAVGSQYTAAISQTDIPGAGIMPASMSIPYQHSMNQHLRSTSDEAFQNKWKTPNHADSFAEAHIKLSRRVSELDTLRGLRMVENMQGTVDSAQ